MNATTCYLTMFNFLVKMMVLFRRDSKSRSALKVPYGDVSHKIGNLILQIFLIDEITHIVDLYNF